VLYPQNFQAADLNAATFSARRLPDRLHYRLVRCNRDGLVRSNPILAQHRLVELYARSHFTYAGETQHLARTYRAALRPALAGRPRNAPLLEVGCGNGFFLQHLQAAGYPNVCGVEPSREAVAAAPAALRPCIVNDVLRPGVFAPERFAVVTLFQVLDHIADPNAFLEVCRAILQPGGALVAFQHDIGSWSYRLLRERSPIIDVEHTHLYDARTGAALLAKHGFKVQGWRRPANLVSLRHVCWLMPLPARLKQRLLDPSSAALRRVLALTCWLKLGNICFTAIKE